MHGTSGDESAVEIVRVDLVLKESFSQKGSKSYSGTATASDLRPKIIRKTCKIPKARKTHSTAHVPLSQCR